MKDLLRWLLSGDHKFELQRLLEMLFLLVMFYLLSYNNLMGLKLYLDWGIPHELIIGWNGVSLTPIFGTLLKAEPNSIEILPYVFLIYDALNVSFILYIWVTRQKKNESQISDPYDRLILLISGALFLYTLGHLLLFLIYGKQSGAYPYVIDLRPTGCAFSAHFSYVSVRRFAPIYERS